MYGYLNEPLELRQAAHMMRAGDRFGIWGLRDASARICCQWLEHLRSESWLEHSQRVEVDHFMHFAKAIEDHDIAWVSSYPVHFNNCCRKVSIRILTCESQVASHLALAAAAFEMH